MKRLIIGAVVASALITVPVVMATGSSDGNTLTATMVVKAANAGSVSFTVTSDSPAGVLSADPNVLTTDGHPVKVTCTVSSDAVAITAPTYTGVSSPASPPKFSSCTDNLKVPAPPTSPTIAPPGTCTSAPCASSVGTGGIWTSKLNDGSDTGGEVLGSGDSIDIQGPANDVASVSSASKECLIDGNPNGTDAPANGAYNDATGADAISGASLSFKIVQNPKFPTNKHYPACPVAGETGVASFSGTYHLSPILKDS